MKNITAQLKKAFTLAEVLITLVIIGVVAALTIPTAIAKYQKAETVNRLKQVFSQFNQAVRLSTSKYGDTSTWDYSLSGFDFFNTYLNSFVVVEEKNHYNSVLTYKTSSGSNETSLTCLYNNSKMIFLNSGTILYADIVNPSSDTQSFQRMCYVVDINGLKGPNQFGRDTFFLCLDGMHGAVVPHHSKDSEPAYVERTRDELKNGVSGNYSYQCNKTNGRGMWCAALIINDSWQIKNDYPW